MNTNVMFTGTLGDAFVKFCRLYRLHDIYGTNFNVYRLTNTYNLCFDKPISDFYSLINWADFMGSYIEGEFISTDLKLTNITEKDILKVYEHYDGIECFPKIDLPIPKDIIDDSVVVQVQGGKFVSPHGEMRGFSDECIVNICKYLSDKMYKVFLIGKNNEYLSSGMFANEIRKLDNVTNLVGKTDDNLTLPMSYIKHSNYFVGFDGFFTFFAPSQRIPTLQFSHLKCNVRMSCDPDQDGCCRWFKYTVMKRPIQCGSTFNINIDEFDKLFSRLEERDFEL